ncbi:Smr domain-containing protein like [Verticillium longisporum]|uniref:Smr domain-containing protein like n=1 Tax=Verticillium longisporum TaxID=100787 RepID=A0A8I2Z3T2_VERLO|nr:Smr domain-containing protein like [Verticillium longisporum]
MRMRADRDRGQSHVYAIVGKGHHSERGIQKLKPAVEKLCREMGLNYATDEHNTGRILINLQGGEAVLPPQGGKHHGQQQQGHHQQQQQQHGGYSGHGQQQHGGHQQQQQHQQGYNQGQQQHQGQQQAQQQQDEGADLLVKLMRKMEKHCCDAWGRPVMRFNLAARQLYIPKKFHHRDNPSFLSRPSRNSNHPPENPPTTHTHHNGRLDKDRGGHAPAASPEAPGQGVHEHLRQRR